MKINIPATKINLIRIKKLLALAEEGHELLEQKRKILMNELSHIIHIIDRIEEEVDTAMKEAYTIADRAMIAMGRKQLEELALSVNIKSSLSISERRVMGVTIPVIKVDIQEEMPAHSTYGVSFYVDELVLRFKDILKLLANVAEKRITLLRIGREAQKTIRKVNAIEKIYLTYYRSALKYISEKLEEEAREALSMMKFLKARIGE